MCKLCDFSNARTCPNYQAAIAANHLALVEVIFSQKTGRQLWIYVEVPLDITEEGFLETVWSRLDCIALAEDMYKLSCDQLTFGDVGQPEGSMRRLQFLRSRRGKYYFNPEVNVDAETRRCKALLTAWVAAQRSALLDAVATGTDADALLRQAGEHEAFGEWSSSLRLIEQAAALGDRKAVNRLARVYQFGTHNVRKDIHRAIGLYNQAGDAGDVDAWFSLGFIFCDSTGQNPEVQRDTAAGIVAYEKAFQLGSADAATLISCEYEDAKDEAKAEQWAREGHKHGSLVATKALATMLHLRGGSAEAIEVCKHGILHSNNEHLDQLGDVMATLGKIYGELENWTDAVHWLECGIAYHSPMAFEELSYCYRNGEGVRPDRTRAQQLLKIGEALKADDDDTFFEAQHYNSNGSSSLLSLLSCCCSW